MAHERVNYLMNVKNIASNQFLFTTIKIQGKTDKGDHVSGTGFFYAFNSSGNGKTFNALITCRHVLENMVEANLLLHIGSYRQEAKDIAMQSADWRKVANL